jgi:hypothetical protein
MHIVKFPTFQVATLAHMHIVKFSKFASTDSKVYKHTLWSFPSLQLYIAKFVGAHC